MAHPLFNIEVAPHPEDPSMWQWSFLSDSGRVLMSSAAAFLDDLDCFNAAKAIRSKMGQIMVEVDSYVS